VPEQLLEPSIECFRAILTHDICLCTNSYQAVDVFADRYQHFSSHVTTLLRSRCLVLNVDTSSSLLNEELCELHDSCKTTVTCIRIGDYWAEKISVCKLRTFGFRNSYPLFALLSVVEELCHEKMANLVRYSCLLIVSYVNWQTREKLT
jgi:hypothetical protein